MPAYRRNHIIPSSLLRFWIDPQTPHDGVHVYDLSKRRSYVSTGKGNKPFSFAIVNDFYIPTAGDVRMVGLERWFSKLEGALVEFARRAHAGEAVRTITRERLTHILMGIISLQHRSRYNIGKVEAALERDAQLAELVSVGDADVRRKALESLVNIVTEETNAMTSPDFVLIQAPQGKSWITCDRPYICALNLPWKFVVLTNQIMIRYGLSDDDAVYCRYERATEQQWEVLNTEIAHQARSWIVSDTAATLGRFAAVTTTPMWSQRKNADHLKIHAVQHLTRGWRIDR